jgi:PAS domain S-box-containing protein
VTSEQQAIYLNAIPLLALGGIYLVAAASLVPSFLRERRRKRELELAFALIFPCGGAAAVIFGLLILEQREPVGGRAWAGLVAVVLALGPALAFFARFRDRALLLTGPARARAAEERSTVHDRERAAASRLSSASSVEEAARALVDEGVAIVGAEFGALLLIDDDGRYAQGVVGRSEGTDVGWMPDVRIDLANEPSGVASAYFEAASFAVYDAAHSRRVSQRLAERAGVKSIVYVPLFSEQRVIAVLIVATLHTFRAFSNEDLATLQSLAGETAATLDRLRSTTQRDEVLERERVIAQIADRIRSALDVDAVVAVATAEVGHALGVQRCFVRLGDIGQPMPVRGEWHADELHPIADVLANRLPVSNLAARERRTIAVADVATDARLADPELGGRQTLLEIGSRAVVAVPIVVFDRLIGVFAAHRTTPGAWPETHVSLVETVAREIGLALDTARLLRENERRLARQAALLESAQALTSELEFRGVIERLAAEVVHLLDADAADCWLFDDQRRQLRCRAVAGLPASELGREISPEGTIGAAIDSRRPVLKREFARTEEPRPSANYREFEEVIDAPIIVLDEVRGVLGVCSRTAGRFEDQDVDLLEAFAALASLAIRNAEAFEEHARQARVQRGFYRIASALGQSLSLTATFDALAQAAAEAYGGSSAAVLVLQGSTFGLAGGHDLSDELQVALEEASGAALRLASDERRVLAAPSLADDERFADWHGLAGALLVVPVETPRAEAAALVVVFFREQRHMTEGDLNLARHLAGAARGALERAELFEAERTSRSLAQQLVRTGGLLASELDPAAVLDEVVAQAPAMVGAESCAVWTIDGDELFVSAASGEDTDLVGARTRATAWLSGEVVQSRRPVALADARDAAAAAGDPFLAAGHAAYLGVPLIGPEGALHGVVALYARRPRVWRPEEIDALLALSANTSAALSNAELYQRVALEKERSAAILENIADGIVAVDRDGDVVLWNRAAEQITGVPASEALGRLPEQAIGRALSGEGLVSIDRGGSEIWLSITEAVMRDPAGLVAGRIYAFRDISGERIVEQMKTQFVSTVSHELRTPLTSIYGFAETLLREDVLFGEEERKVFLRYIASESERLTRIVDALLNVARLDTGDLHVQVAPTDVAPVVTELVSSVKQDGDDGHSFVLDLPSEPLTAEADADKLRQVLAHLVENAVKYSPQGGTVTIAVRRKRDRVEFHVADQGIGIPETERERIFRKFYRAEREGLEGAGGTGLGLFIVQGLVNAMGGRIWVESAEGEGSRFAFELPVARV